MSAPSTAGRRGAGWPATSLLAGTAFLLATVGGLPLLAGGLAAGAGIAASALLRSARARRSDLVVYGPVLLALSLLTVTSPPLAPTAVLAGICGIAFLVWSADDPAHPAGSVRRSLSILGLVTVAVGLAWAIVLFFGRGVVDLGVAGGLLALSLFLLALLLVRPIRALSAAPTEAAEEAA